MCIANMIFWGKEKKTLKQEGQEFPYKSSFKLPRMINQQVLE